MAASSKIGGYQCEFVGTVSEDFVCGLCKHVAREPHLTSCCSETFCQVCITSIIEDKKPCPSCETVQFSTIFIVKYQRRILAIEVHCTMKDRGCEWTGKLEGLEAHLDVNTGDCEYVDIECPNKCDLPVEKRNLPTHLTNYCPKREFICQYCNFKATYEVVSNDHWPQCSFYPVPCSNACGIQAIERGDLEAHLLQCPLEVVECDFSHAGCNTKLPRQDLERHMEESTQQHLVLMSAKSLKFEQRLQEQQDVFQQKLQETAEMLQKALEEKDEKIKAELQKKTQEHETQIRDLQQQVEVLQKNYILPVTIKMPDFKDRKDKTEEWSSSPLYTHSGGYKFYIRVLTAGLFGDGYVTAFFFPMKGEFNSQLKWPVNCTITLQVLNQERDKDHVSVTQIFWWDNRSKLLPHSPFKIIAHKDLEYNAQKRTCYLKNDCLLFRVTLVEVN